MLDSPPPEPGSGAGSRDALAVEAASSAPKLSLTDFLDVATLQEMQDSFNALTRLATTIRDADGRQITAPTDTAHRAQSDRWLEHLITGEEAAGGRFTAPILVEGKQLGFITLEPSPPDGQAHPDQACFLETAKRLGLPSDHTQELLEAARACFAPNRAASIQFLYLLANAIARLCYEEYNARQRVEELSALYKISTLLSAHWNVQQVLDAAARSVAEVMRVKAVSIRLLDEDAGNELIPRATFNLSQEFLNKGAIRLEQSELFREALAGKVIHVEDMHSDPRVLFPENAQREGLVSMLCVGMIYQGRPIGTLQLFTGEMRRFMRSEINLIRAMSHLLATAIENARLDQARLENQRIIRQIRLAADVQRRMLPGAMPHLPPFDIAARYVPSLELGGDFYDFIDLDGHLGIAVGDVVGKGMAASLLMASVRASLRAFAQDVYDLDEIIARVNAALCRDTLDNEFATLWYGVLDPRSRRLTYCNAGHEPAMLLRHGQIHPLGVGGMIVGVDPHQTYQKALWDLQSGDVVLLYTDGLVDAFNPDRQRFGRPRIEQALREAADRSAADILNHILWSMRKFAGIHRSIDDTTLVVVKAS